MQAEKTDDGKVRLSFDIKEANTLAEAILHHNEDMSTAALDLAGLLHTAYYKAKDDFRQPPHPWDADAPQPPSVDAD